MADLNSLEKQIDTLARAMAGGFDDVNNKFEEIGVRFQKVDERFDKIDQKLERIERSQLTQKEEIITLDTRVTKLEEPAAH